jgi:hypothetical protein
MFHGSNPIEEGVFMTHHSIEHRLDKSVQIWRYMSVEKFALLMSRKELWFTRADLLGDEHEGSLPDSVIDERQQRLKNLRVKAIVKRGSEASVKDAFVSCWSMQTPEALSMWKIYTPNAKGFAVKTTIDRLANCFVSKPNDLFDHYNARIEKVTYIDFLSHQTDADTYDRFMHKQQAYCYEKEIRAIVSSMPTVEEPRIGIGLDVDLGILVDTVYVSHRPGDGLEQLAEDLLREAGITKKIAVPPFVRNSKY